jgi:hypothetical protein
MKGRDREKESKDAAVLDHIRDARNYNPDAMVVSAHRVCTCTWILTERKVSNKECMPFTGDDSFCLVFARIGRRLNSSRCLAVESSGRFFDSRRFSSRFL